MYRVSKLQKCLTTTSQWNISQQNNRILNHVRNCVSAATSKDTKTDFTVGDKLHGYTIKQVSDIEEFHAQGILLEHDNTGAQHLHISRDDHNNVFSVAFRTTPMDSTGVSHILEHTVLCGSEKYPCRDPFFKMLNRSLSTFMNAFTASDWTMYPFSTQNLKDYENLMSVYLDAAFFPKLNQLDFFQEGWRLEQEDLTNQKSDITFKGVVFNEMKGALSNGESLFHQHHQCLLLPHHTYGYNSGGDPLHIPNLTYEQLKEFHAYHYHPSNSKFYTYGNFPLENHLKVINENVMKRFGRINPETYIPVEPRWSTPRSAAIYCPPDPLAADIDKQTTVAVSYMMNYTEDPFEGFVMGMLSALLVDGPNSPFYQALIQPNIGSSYAPVVGADNNTKNATFSVGLQGINKNDVTKVVDIIKETFIKVASEGFEQERIDSLLHSIELSQKHQTSSFGLSMIMSVIPAWNQDKNPLDQFNINKQVERFKQTMTEDNEFLQKKVKEYFLDNSHELTLVMDPKEDYAVEKEKEEMELLHEKVKNLTEEDKLSIYENALKLEELQNEIEDVSCLPKMLVADIDKNIKKTDIEKQLLNNVNIFKMDQPTNGITYFRTISTTTSIPYILRPYLPLFCRVLTKLGAGQFDYKELSQQIELHTGGLGVSPHISTHHTDEDSFEQGLMLSSHCLERNIPMMFYLWQEVLNNPSFFNHDRLKTLINSYANDLSSSVAQSGHLYAISAASKNLTPSSQIAELFGGLSQVNFMKLMAEKEDLDEIIQNLCKIATYMLNSNEMRCSLNTSNDLMESSLQGLEGLVSSLNVVGFDDETIFEENDFKGKSNKTFIEMDFPVNYVSKCIRTVPYSHPDNSRLQILAKILSAKYLHREIREKGGAYGGGAKMGGGIFSFFSYRDPNTVKTLEAFNGSIDWACNGEFTNDDIEEAKLSVFSAVDSPVAPANRGMSLFQSNLTDELRQQRRDRLFSTQKEELVDVANRYLQTDAHIQAEVIIGPKNEILTNDNSWTIPRDMSLNLS